jgi:hypothetical protein
MTLPSSSTFSVTPPAEAADLVKTPSSSLSAAASSASSSTSAADVIVAPPAPPSACASQEKPPRRGHDIHSRLKGAVVSGRHGGPPVSAAPTSSQLTASLSHVQSQLNKSLGSSPGLQRLEAAAATVGRNSPSGLRSLAAVADAVEATPPSRRSTRPRARPNMLVCSEWGGLTDLVNKRARDLMGRTFRHNDAEAYVQEGLGDQGVLFRCGYVSGVAPEGKDELFTMTREQLLGAINWEDEDKMEDECRGLANGAVNRKAKKKRKTTKAPNPKTAPREAVSKLGSSDWDDENEATETDIGSGDEDYMVYSSPRQSSDSDSASSIEQLPPPSTKVPNSQQLPSPSTSRSSNGTSSASRSRSHRVLVAGTREVMDDRDWKALALPAISRLTNAIEKLTESVTELSQRKCRHCESE